TRLAPRDWLRRNATMAQKPRIAIDPCRLNLVGRHSCVARLGSLETHSRRDHMIALALRRAGPLGTSAGDSGLPNRHVHTFFAYPGRRSLVRRPRLGRHLKWSLGAN